MTEEKEKPLTREDVLRLIEQNGGNAKGLDLSTRNLEKVDLSGLDLQGIILNEANIEEANLSAANLQGANLEQANLQKARLEQANLQKARLLKANLQGANPWAAKLQEANLAKANLQEADLRQANLQKARLSAANLQGANLRGGNLQKAYLTGANLQKARLEQANLQGAKLGGANLRGAFLSGADISPTTKLEDVDWGDFILGDEKARNFQEAAHIYRNLKQWYTNAGMYDVAAKFYYREMEVRRKEQRWTKEPHLKLWSWAMRLLCGYGEKPLWLGGWAILVIFGLAGFYTWLGSFSSGAFWSCLYYSAASFTALGYGNWAPQPTGWAKGMGAAEAVIGVFMMALFLVTFTRKMVR